MLQLNQLVLGTDTLKVLIPHLETGVSVCYICLTSPVLPSQSILETAQVWTRSTG